MILLDLLFFLFFLSFFLGRNASGKTAWNDSILQRGFFPKSLVYNAASMFALPCFLCKVWWNGLTGYGSHYYMMQLLSVSAHSHWKFFNNSSDIPPSLTFAFKFGIPKHIGYLSICLLPSIRVRSRVQSLCSLKCVHVIFCVLKTVLIKNLKQLNHLSLCSCYLLRIFTFFFSHKFLLCSLNSTYLWISLHIDMIHKSAWWHAEIVWVQIKLFLLLSWNVMFDHTIK